MNCIRTRSPCSHPEIKRCIECPLHPNYPKYLAKKREEEIKLELQKRHKDYRTFLKWLFKILSDGYSVNVDIVNDEIFGKFMDKTEDSNYTLKDLEKIIKLFRRD